MSLIINDVPGFEDVELTHLYVEGGIFRPCGVSLRWKEFRRLRSGKKSKRPPKSLELDLTDMHIYHLVRYWIESVDLDEPEDVRLRLVEEIKNSTLEPGWNSDINPADPRKRIQFGDSANYRDQTNRKSRKNRTRYQIARESKIKN